MFRLTIDGKGLNYAIDIDSDTMKSVVNLTIDSRMVSKERVQIPVCSESVPVAGDPIAVPEPEPEDGEPP